MRQPPTAPIALALLAVAMVWSAASCGTARRGVPLTDREPPADSPTLRTGERVFDTYCNGCHPGGTAGVGLALNDKPLPEAAIRLQVRQGVGAMPGFSEAEISDAELDALVAYMQWLHTIEVDVMETDDGR